MNAKDLNQKVFIFVFIGILVLALIIIFILRFTVFKTGKYLTSLEDTDLSDKGYGTYSTVFETGCLTADGKCSTSGIKYSTQYCVANPTTGRGCLDENGEMTFASQTLQAACLPNCRQFTLNQLSGTNPVGKELPWKVCSYSDAYTGSQCVPPSAKTYNYNVLECINNDSVGENACSYVCGSDGVTDNGTSGDSIPTLPSYIPSCVNRKGLIISLKSFPWQLRGNLPPQGVVLSKGYTITNFINPDGSINNSLFNVSPPYLNVPTFEDPNPSPKSTILFSELYDLDSKLVVYENCVTKIPKPICGREVIYKPTQVGGTITTIDQPFPTRVPPNFQQTAQCYVDPYWNPDPTPVPGSLSQNNALNPYTGTLLNGEFTINAGIGQFGYTYEYQSCINNTIFPTLESNTGGVNYYNIPLPYQAGIGCPSLQGVTGVTGTSGTSSTCFIDRSYIPSTVTSGSYTNICNVVYPNGKNAPGYNGATNAPGTVTPCQYMPDSSVLDFTGPALNDNLNEWIGNYIQIYATESSSTADKYFMGLVTSPCAAGVDSGNQLPLANCSLVQPLTSAGYTGQSVIFIKTGGDENSISAGSYWGKNNCDGEMIELVNSLNIVVSPRNDIISFTTDEIQCDLYGYFGRVYGQFYVDTIPASGTDPSYQMLKFNPLTQAQYTNKSVYTSLPNNTPLFKLKYNTSVSSLNYEITTSDGQPIYLASYDGNKLDLTYTNLFSISGVRPTVLYYRSLPFNGQIIKRYGNYSELNITNAVGLQRGNQCYYSNCDPSNPLNTEPCFPNTCNLYFEYNVENCG
jgi:hypothetical protein